MKALDHMIKEGLYTYHADTWGKTSTAELFIGE